ncbi:MAG: hypothetical protein PSX79_07560, partial [bacterium]|nr:hypothetical protein [bacterium]
MLQLIAPLLWILTATTVLLAWWRGGAAERFGATMILVGNLFVVAIHFLVPVPAELLALALLMTDAALAVGFLIAAMRYLSPWLGLAMILQAIQFSLHAYYLIGEKPHDYLYRAINNVNTFAILLIILA